YYPRSWFSTMIKAHRQHPSTILCGRGHLLRQKSATQLMPYMDMCRKREDGNLVGLNLMPKGVSVVLYPVGSLDSVVTNEERFTKLAPYADDVWFKACSLLKESKVMRVYWTNQRFFGVRGTHES